MKFVEQDKSYEIKHGEALNSNLIKYLKFFKEPDQNIDKNILLLSYLSLKYQNVLDKIINPDFMKNLLNSAKYTCRYTAYQHFSLMPIAIVTNNHEYYIEKFNGYLPHYTEMSKDYNWNIKGHYLNQNNYSNKILSSLLGPGLFGYDGSSSKNILTADLENGDSVLFMMLQYHSK